MTEMVHMVEMAHMREIAHMTEKARMAEWPTGKSGQRDRDGPHVRVAHVTEVGHVVEKARMLTEYSTSWVFQNLHISSDTRQTRFDDSV